MKARYCFICGDYVVPSKPFVELPRGKMDSERKVRHVNCEPGTETFFKKATAEAKGLYLDIFRRFPRESDRAVMARLGVSHGHGSNL